MPFDALLFDLDGTLLNTLDDLADSCNYALAQMGYPRHSALQVRDFINNGARRLIERACPANTADAQIDRCLSIFQAHYKTNLDNKTKPYEGVLDMLAGLRARGVKIGVVSNKFDGAVKPLCRRYFEELVDVAIGECESHGIRRKPAPDSVFAALAALSVDRARALYVGDSNVDIETARNAQLPCLSVSWGFRPKESLIEPGATRIVDTVDALIPAVWEMGAAIP